MKNGLNASFYKWIDDVKKAIRHKAELEEKLKYYEEKLVGYNAVVYDTIGSRATRSNTEENLLYTIGKIDDINNRATEIQLIVLNYILFKEKLKEREKSLLEFLVETEVDKSTIALKMKISKSRLYSMILSIIRKYVSLLL